MSAADWPYDARQDDPLTALRIPVVRTTNPGWCYLVAVCVNEDPDSVLDHGMRPTDYEVALIRSFIDYYRSRYSETWRTRELDARPFDIDGTGPNVLLLKRGEGDWAYRHSTWTRGPHVVPVTWGGEEQALDLLGLFDRIQSWGKDGNVHPAWTEWKAAHPEIFEPDDDITCKHCGAVIDLPEHHDGGWEDVMPRDEGGTGSYCPDGPGYDHHPGVIA